MENDIKLYMIELLEQRGAYHRSVNQMQHYTRCPYCGDSKNMSHAHLSIHINVDDDTPMLFRCLKCGVSGIVSEHVFDELGLYIDSESRKQLRLFNRKGIKRMGLTNMDREAYTVPLYHKSILNDQKLNYINQRLGTSIGYEKAHSYKIVLNLFDFMKHNELKMIDGVSDGMMQTLHNNYVGYLSCNNNSIVFRDITDTQKYRYFKVKLNQKNMNGDSFYSLPSSIPLLYTDDIHVHLAEGSFDILSIRENLVREEENNFYYATCGFGGAVILHYLIHHGINTGIHLHLYSDADKSDWDHRRYLSNAFGITEWMDHIYIHRNQFNREKDYGVPLSHIIDSKKEILRR